MLVRLSSGPLPVEISISVSVSLDKLIQMTIRLTALIGFSPFETMTLESFFRLAGRRPPGYAIVADPAHAHVLIVNADNEAVVRDLVAREPTAQVILIGANAHGSRWTLMPRPIRLLAVLDMIEKLLMSHASLSTGVSMPTAIAPQAPTAVVQATPLAPPLPSAAPSVAPTTTPTAAPTWISTASFSPAALPTPVNRTPAVIFEPLPRADPPAAQAPSSIKAVSQAFQNTRSGLMGFGNSLSPISAAPNLPAGASVSAKDDDDLILVVDDSDIVLRFMQGRLQRFGYSVELASTGEQAVQMAQVRAYKFVFLDVMMPGIDGYQTCRLIKKQKHASGTPVVVMLSSRGGSIDKIRGTLAGADSYLTKPLAEAALIKVLADHDTQTANNFSATRPVSGLR